MREIITIQVGRQANYVGTHFWNAQESYHTFGSAALSPVDHDVHFRQGVGGDGSDTYLPRTVIYDLRGGFGSLARVNALGADVAEPEEGEATWSGSLARMQQISAEPSAFLQSLLAQQPPVFPTPATTKYFSDFASTFYHPRSLVPINPSHPVLDPSSQASTNDLPSFVTHADGSSLFDEINAEYDIYDRDLRLWVEECDHMQGLQIFSSADDAWAGFTSAYIQEIRDQLGKSCVWVWGLSGLEQTEQNQRARMAKNVNRALSLTAFHEHASLYVPISLPVHLPHSIQLDRSILWHTSALVSASIESATLPLRLRAETGRHLPSLGDWEDALGDGGHRKVVELGLEAGSSSAEHTMSNGHGPNLTNGASADSRLADAHVLEDDTGEQEAIDAPMSINLFPNSEMVSLSILPRHSKTYARIDSYRGSGWDIVASRAQHDQDQSFIRRGQAIVEAYSTNTPLLPLVATFPHIFADAAAPSKTETPGMRAHAGLRTSSATARWIRDIEQMLRRTPISVMMSAAGDADREALQGDLGTLSSTYVEEWDSADEGSGDDY